MNTPVFVREMTDTERQALEAGLRSSDAFVLRRCQIVLSSMAGKRAPKIADEVHCDADTVLSAIHGFNERGTDVLVKRSNRPHEVHATFDDESAKSLVKLVHQSPRALGKDTSLWTLDLLADVSFAEGLTPKRVSRETIRVTLARFGIRWRRAKQWIISPDPEYAQKKAVGTGC
jgi:transposase